MDENTRPKQLLSKGEHKSTGSGYGPVRRRRSPTVRWIFDQFLLTKSEAGIARELNRRGILNSWGRPWDRCSVSRILKNENYIGNMVFNRPSCRLKQKPVNNPEHAWVRSTGALTPIIEPSVFARVQKLIPRLLHLPDDEMLLRLRKALHKKGRLTTRIIDQTPGLPKARTYISRFGSLLKAYRLIGYTAGHDYDTARNPG